MIVCACSWWHWYNKYRQSSKNESGMRKQTTQSNAGSDGPYFRLPPLTTSFVAANAIPTFSIHDVENKIGEGATSCLKYLCCIITCFDSYECNLFDRSSQLDKPEFSKCLRKTPFSRWFSRAGVYWKTRTIPGLSEGSIKIKYIPRCVWPL